MNVITGEAAPSHGCVFVCGLDLVADTARCQQRIGVCAQDDLLYDEVCLPQGCRSQ